MAQICRNDDEMPNFLLPNNSKIGTVKPTAMPATDQCQGCLMSSNMFLRKKMGVDI
jgi:hypothetical protein